MIFRLTDYILSFLFSFTAIPIWTVIFFIFFLPILIVQFVRHRTRQILEEARGLSKKYSVIVDTRFLPQIKRVLGKTKGGTRTLYDTLEDRIYKRTCWYLRRELSDYIHKNDHVLDIGSGRGYLDWEIKKKIGADVICVDVYNYSSVGLPVVIYDGIHLPFSDKAFDVVLLSYVLHHSGKRQLELLNEAKRVCRGRIIIYEDEAVGGVGQLFRSFHGPAFNFIVGIRDGTTCVFHNSHEWQRIFERLGLRILVKKVSWNIGAIVLPVKRAFFVLAT